MKTKISTLAIGLFAMVTPMIAAPAQLSQIFPDLNVIYGEVFDAGQSISGGSYQVASPGSPGDPLTQITGSILNTSDADIFQIAIASPAAFSATTVNALTTGNGIDTVLWLFNSSGVGVIANDDANGTTLQSTLSSFIGSGGVFYLAISLTGNEPVNFANQLMFASNGGDPTAVRGPAGGVSGPQSDFDPSGVGFGAFTGNYQIDLVGATVVPEPSVAAAFILGGLVSGAVFFARRRRSGRSLLVLAAFGVFVTSSMFATDIPKNLGYGLDKLVESNLILKGQGGDKGKKKSSLVGDFNGYATQEAANYAAMAIMGKDGRVKVDITLSGKVPFEQMRTSLPIKFASLEITAVDATYRSGIIEGWLSVDDAAALSQVPGVRAVFLGLKPQTNSGLKSGPSVEGGYDALIGPSTNFAMVGTKFLQGVTQHRVDKINQFYNASAPVNYNGNGITVGVLSDSFGSNVAATATNVTNFDLPGAAGNPNNTVPVVVLQDVAGSDEGRGMCEIVYKMAPKAKIGFATAFTGEVEFANNIRALSGQFPAVPHTQVGFAATVICDDVSYGGEPVFSDGGIIGNGIDDVAAVGVAYFSSAANSYGVSCYNSDLRMVAYTGGTTAADCTALVGTNVNLAGVPTNLYQGGFHNFTPAAGQLDVACLWNLGSSSITGEMQWDDPYDTSDPVVNEPPIYTNTGVGGPTPVTFTDIPGFTAGQEYVITETATSGNFDGIVSIIDSNANVIVDQDTGTDEVVIFFSPTTEQYSISVRRFASTAGNFDLKINTANGTPLLSTDLNLLVFRADTGAYIGSTSLTSNNIANNRPVELGTITRPTTPTVQTQVQFVIARAFVPTAPRPATRVRCGTAANSNSGNAPAEYFDYNSAVTDGHSIVAGCNGSAAYEVFRPNVPQNFTSGGPALIYFDRDQNLKPNAPEIRLQPRIAAANGANSTWTTSGDSANDIDTGNGQFYGTSAASPHAAGVAALVQQAHGGPTSVTSTQMTSILQSTAFPHDLDPYTAIGTARATNGGKVTVTIRSDNTAPAGATQNRGRLDANSHTIAYTGPSSISTFKFNPNGLISQGGAVTSGQNGVDGANNYFSTVTPGMYFAIATALGAEPFALGSGTVGLILADVVPLLTNPAGAPANPANGQTLTLTFTPGSFTGGDLLRFKIGRGIIRGANVAAVGGASTTNYNADLFGGGVLIPENITIADGMRFSGTLADGATFEGIMKNRIGKGYSQLDGFGFLNAEAAVSAPLP